MHTRADNQLGAIGGQGGRHRKEGDGIRQGRRVIGTKAGTRGGKTGGRRSGGGRKNVAGRRTDEFEQHPFGCVAGRRAHVGTTHRKQHVPADADETGGLVRRQDHGEAPLVGEQTHDGVAQIAEGQPYGMAGRGTPRIGTGERIDKERRVGDDQVELSLRGELLYGALHERYPAAPRRGIGILARLRNVFHVDTRDPGPGDTLCHHQCNKPCTATYIEDAPVRRTHRDPGTQQHAVRPDLHRAAILAYGELFEAEHRLYALR